ASPRGNGCAAVRRSARGVERALEIAAQVALVLDADRQPDEAVGDAERGAPIGRDARVRHDRGVLDQRLDAAERLGEREDLAGAEEAARLVEPAAQDEADHAAEARRLRSRERMLRVRLQAGVDDLLDLRVRLEPGRE